MTVGELKAILADARKPNAPDARRAMRGHLDRLRAIEAEEQEQMRRDSKLPPDIVRASWSPSSKRIVLLTGGTGFLDSFLLEALLRMTPDDIVAVVRAEDTLYAKARIGAALKRTGLMTESVSDALAARVLALPGDLGRLRLGLERRWWERLSNEVSRIYHCGASVDYVQPYSALRGPNVNGTIEVLRLAVTGTEKVVHHISTTFVFGFVPRKVCYEGDRNQEMQGLNFGYPQTKWVSEQLVHEAGRRGTPVRIYRPAMVTASARGRYARHDLLARILAYMIKHGISIDSLNQLSLIPVDVCANNIVAVSRLDRPNGECYHLTASDYYTMANVCHLMSDRHGYPFRYMSLEDMIAHVNEHCGSEDPLYSLVAFFNHNVRRIDSMWDKRYDRANYTLAAALSEASIPEPALEDVVGSIVSFLERQRLIGTPRAGCDAGAAPGVA